MNDLPKSYSQKTARALGDKVSILLAPHLPNCTPRRFDTAIPLVKKWPIELFLNSNGPIAPKIFIKTTNSLLSFDLYFGLMFLDRRDFLTTEIYDSRAPQFFRLEQGPEAIVEAAVKGFSKFNLAEFVARGTPDGVMKSRPQRNYALICLQLAQCALYVGRDDEATELLRDTVRYANEDSLNRFAGLAAEARSYLSRLGSDSGEIRKELAATTEHSWSHFKIAKN